MKIKGTVPMSGANPLIHVGDHLRVPQLIKITGEAQRSGEQNVVIDAEYSEVSGRYEVRSFTVTADEGEEITGETLRSVPVTTVLNAGVQSALQPITLLTANPLPDDITEGGPTTRALQWVAYLYRVALILGAAPIPMVADALELPRSTASRWITRARDRGFLTVQDKRGQRGRQREDGESLD